jgi:cytochrome c556
MKIKILLPLILSVFSLAAVHAADVLDEKAFQKHMKAVGKTTKAFKANFESKNAAAIEKDGADTAAAYKAMAAFFKARKNDDAVKWSDDSAAGAAGAAVAAKAGDWDKVKSEWGAVGKNCKACHDKYREKLDDGSYKIK